MSAKFSIFQDGEQFVVEISPDGDLTFVDYEGDINYDILAESLGEDPTAAFKIISQWDSDPIKVICENLTRYYGEKRVTKLAADWAAHVLPIFEKYYPDDVAPRNAIDMARDYIYTKDLSHHKLDTMKKTANTAHSSHVNAKYDSEKAKEDEGFYTARQLEMASKVALSAKWAVLIPVEKTLGKVAAYLASKYASEATPSKEAEISWQIRHFALVLERFNADLPWPDIKETP